MHAIKSAETAEAKNPELNSRNKGNFLWLTLQQKAIRQGGKSQNCCETFIQSRPPEDCETFRSSQTKRSKVALSFQYSNLIFFELCFSHKIRFHLQAKQIKVEAKFYDG